MGRQEDLNRLHPQHRSASSASVSQAEVVQPAPAASGRRRPLLRVRRGVRRYFGLWITLLLAMALVVIGLKTSRVTLGWSPNSPASKAALVNASSIDRSRLEMGDRVLDLIVTQGWHSRHMGVDVARPHFEDSTGIPLYAIGPTNADVEVFCWYDPIAGLNISTYAAGMEFAFDYSHLHACATPVGERGTVKAGQKIAEIGNTGAATTGPHLHFQQRQNGTANPVTGEHVPGWRGYVELSLSGQTLSATGGVENGAQLEPLPLITPSGDPRRPSTAPAPSNEEPMEPPAMPPGMSPEIPPAIPEPAESPPAGSPSPVVPSDPGAWRSPTVSPPI
jgi:hypothetical protein